MRLPVFSAEPFRYRQTEAAGAVHAQVRRAEGAAEFEGICCPGLIARPSPALCEADVGEAWDGYGLRPIAVPAQLGRPRSPRRSSTAVCGIFTALSAAQCDRRTVSVAKRSPASRLLATARYFVPPIRKSGGVRCGRGARTRQRPRSGCPSTVDERTRRCRGASREPWMKLTWTSRPSRSHPRSTRTRGHRPAEHLMLLESSPVQRYINESPSKFANANHDSAMSIGSARRRGRCGRRASGNTRTCRRFHASRLEGTGMVGIASKRRHRLHEAPVVPHADAISERLEALAIPFEQARFSHSDPRGRHGCHALSEREEWRRRSRVLPLLRGEVAKRCSGTNRSSSIS